MKSLRIDFVITELFVGGAERCLTELACGLQQRGERVRVHSIGRFPSNDQALLLDRLRDSGVPVSSSDCDGVHSWLSAYRDLKSRFRKDPPDLCQTFLFHANVLATHAARHAGVPVCVGGLRVAEANRWRCWLESRAVRHMNRLICVSEATREFAEEKLDARADQLQVIGNAVDVHRFQSAEPVQWSDLQWPANSQVTLFVGRLHPQKGIELLQRQIDRIAPVGTNRRLLLMGSGPLHDSISNWVKRIGPERVALLPWQADVAPWMRAAALLVLPSRYEGMPNVVLEAMASGRPVVCSRVEGSAELLAHRYEEQTFDSGDDAAMADRIIRVLDDKAVTDALGRANARRAESEFSISKMVDRYQQTYRTIVEGESP